MDCIELQMFDFQKKRETNQYHARDSAKVDKQKREKINQTSGPFQDNNKIMKELKRFS